MRVEEQKRVEKQKKKEEKKEKITNTDNKEEVKITIESPTELTLISELPINPDKKDKKIYKIIKDDEVYHFYSNGRCNIANDRDNRMFDWNDFLKKDSDNNRAWLEKKEKITNTHKFDLIEEELK
jgi:hypothetical protein